MSLQPEVPDPDPPVRRGQANSTDVARVAGVSRATVSHVLNGHTGRFSPATVARVRLAAETLGYVPSTAGRALVMGRSDLIVLVAPHSTLSNIQDTIEAIEADLRELGFSLVVHFRQSGPGSFGYLRHTVETLRPAGVIDLGGLGKDEATQLEQAGGGIVFSGTSDDAGPDGNMTIGRLQAQHLIDRGYSRLVYALLSDDRQDFFGRVRAQAVDDVCVEHGLAPAARIEIPMRPAEARAALSAALTRTGPPVAVACSSDEVALAVTFAALALGLDVPGDVAVIGANGGDVGQVVTPRLSTVSFEMRDALLPIRRSVAEAFGKPLTHARTGPDKGFFVIRGQTT